MAINLNLTDQRSWERLDNAIAQTEQFPSWMNGSPVNSRENYTDAYNRGQSDASEGSYDPPSRQPSDVVLDGLVRGHEDYEEVLEAYEKGDNHTSSQK